MSGSAAVKYLLSNDSDLQVDDLDIYVDDKFAEDLVEFFEEHGFRFSRKKHQTGRASDVLAMHGREIFCINYKVTTLAFVFLRY